MRNSSWPLLLALLSSYACGGSSGGSSNKDVAAASDDAATADEDAAGGVVDDVTSGGSEPDTAVPGDEDGDGVLDQDDCAPKDAAVSSYSVERPANAVDDDCDGTTDEAALPLKLGVLYGEPTIRPSSTTIAFGTVVYFPESPMSFTDAVLTLKADDGEPLAGVTTTFDRLNARVDIVMPLDVLDLRVLNPGKVGVTVLVQSEGETYSAEGDLHISVIPERAAVADVDGTLYAIIPPQLAIRQGSSLFYATEFIGSNSETSPGIWSFGPTPAEFGTLPNLFYFTTGAHPDTGGEAYLRDCSELWQGDGYSATSSNGGTAHLFQFEAKDLNDDGTVDVADLALVDLYGWAVSSDQPE
jgi:hypothetical protein